MVTREKKEDTPPPAQLTKAPRVLKTVPAVYPSEALQAGKEATVVVRIELDATGRVVNVSVPQPVGDGFDEAAIAAIRQWEFEPAEVNGAPSPIVIEYPFRFVLDVDRATREATPDGSPSGEGRDNAPEDRAESPALAGDSSPFAPDPTDNPTPERTLPAMPAGADTEAKPADNAPRIEEPPAPIRIEGRVFIRGGAGPLRRGQVALVRDRKPPEPPESPSANPNGGAPPEDGFGEESEVNGVEGRDFFLADLDEQGRFALRGVPDGRWRVVIDERGFERQEQAVVLVTGEALELTLYVTKAWVGPESDEVVVRGKIEKTTISRKALRAQELTTVPGTFGDPLRAVLNLPGFARPPLGLGVILIRGSNPQDSQVMVDGGEVPNLYHFLAGPSVLNPNFLESVEYEPGNPSARYGRLIAGVVEVRTRTFDDTEWHGAADVDFFDAGLFATGPLAPGYNLALSLRRSYIDAILAGVLGRDGAAVLPVYWDYQLKLDATATKPHTWSFFAYGSDDRLTVATGGGGGGPADINSRIAFHRIQLGYAYRGLDGIKVDITQAVGGNYFRFAADENIFDVAAGFTHTRADLDAPLAKGLRLRSGIDGVWSYFWIDAEIPRPTSYREPVGGTGFTGRRDPFKVRNWIGSVGFWTEFVWEPLDGLTIVPGLRAEVHRYGERTPFRVDPRAVARYSPWKDGTFKVGAGLYHQPVDPAQGRVDSTYGNPRLDPEWSDQYSVGYEHRFGPLFQEAFGVNVPLSVELSLYWVNRHDLVQFTDRTVDDGSGRPKALRYDNGAEGRSYGMEVLIRHDPSEFFYGWLAYTLSRSEIRSQMFDREGKSSGFVATQFDQTHNLTLVASFRLPLDFEAGLRFRLVSGRPETPIEEGTYNGVSGNYQPWLGAPRSRRYETFHQLDLRLDKHFRFDTWRFSLYLDVQNVYFAENPEIRLNDYRFRHRGYINGIPILPSLGVEAQW